jgi:hypothetical protein
MFTKRCGVGTLALVAFAASSPLAGCGGDSAPFGGPHGGTWDPPAPTEGPAGEDGGGDGGSSGGGSSSGGSSGSAPTWTEIYNLYLTAGKIGDCTDTNILCHSQYHSPSAMYGYLMNQSQIGPMPPPLTDPNQSCLTWFAGANDTVMNLMPLTGSPKSAQAVSDMTAWAAAGAQNN